jgi:hypothetical protein
MDTWTLHGQSTVWAVWSPSPDTVDVDARLGGKNIEVMRVTDHDKLLGAALAVVNADRSTNDEAFEAALHKLWLACS